MAKASKNTPAKSTSKGKKNSKITETGSKRGLSSSESKLDTELSSENSESASASLSVDS
ncbi:hypothetical protein BDR03DRAFT_976599 [Suillus americanus]|nr:hypothetical protein BDR03DRAFT_976599 [Suillus americanus]